MIMDQRKIHQKNNYWIKSSQIILLSAIMFLAVSCDPGLVYEENIAIEDASWHKDDIKSFSFEVTDTVSPLDLYVNIRTTNDYPYSNLYLFLYSEYPDGYTDKDTLDFILAYPDGKWIGENSGTIIENQVLISRGGRFAKEGTYTFEIQHAMRDEFLPEVTDIGFRVAITDDEDLPNY